MQICLSPGRETENLFGVALYIYRYVGGTIVGLSYMSFQNRHSVKTSCATMASRED